MVSEYRFLRFEIAGLFTVFSYSLLMLPIGASFFSSLKSVEFGVTAVATLFLASLPLGYWEHQLVVNRYRSDNMPRRVHGLLKDMVEASSQTSPIRGLYDKITPEEANSFLTVLSELGTYSENMGIKPEIFDRLSDRWSHFYARKAVALYGPLLSVVFFAATVIAGFFFGLKLDFGNLWISIILGVVVLVPNYFLINPYSRKIWQEIDLLEAQILLANKEKMKDLLNPSAKL
jgi:hypothetical protein